MKNYSCYLFILFITIFFNSGKAQTIITESINTNTTWTINGSPYIISTFGVTVEEGNTLTIEPGVEVHFDNYTHNLRVAGTLQAVGDEGNKIRFWGSETIYPDLYGGIYVDGGIANISHAEFERNGPIAESNYFDPLYAQIYARSGTLNIDHSSFWNSSFWYGIGLEEATVFNGNNNNFDATSEGFTAYLVAPDVAMTMNIADNNYASNFGFITISGTSEDANLIWDNKEVPYVAYTPTLDNTNLTIEPGVEMNFYSGGAIWMAGGSLTAEGTDIQPIRFVGGFPTGFSYGGGVYIWGDESLEISHYFEHCVFQQLNYGILSYPVGITDSLFSVKSSSFDNILENAIYSYLNWPIITSNCFSNIEGNAIVNAGFDFTNTPVFANNNYWDDPTGAYHPVNYPNGLGETIGNGVIADNPLNTCPNLEFVDLAVGELLSPDISSCQTGADFAITVRIDNIGFTDQSDFDLQLSINNASPVTVSPNITVPGSGSATFIFDQTIDINYFESNEIEIFILFPADQNIANNTSNFFIQSIPFDGQTEEYVEVCENENSFYLEASGGSNYLWSTGSTSSFTFLYPPIISGDYYVTITNFEGCVDVDTITVEAFPAPVVPTFFQSSTYLCSPDGSMTLTVPNLTDNLIWNTEETTSSITVNQEGLYSVTHVGNDGCESSYSQYVDYESTPDISDDAILCNQNSTNIFTSSPTGSSYEWSIGDSTSFINVQPTETTTYSVTITTPNNCVHILESTITVASDAPPGEIGNMLPIDGAQNITLPVQFSWSPGANANNYNVFIWETGSSPSGFPNFSTSQISNSYTGNLQFGNTYNWKVCSQNICSTSDTVCSTIQQFTLNYLPDLIIDDNAITFPDSAFSGTEIEIGWEVFNQGIGSTQGVSSNAEWYDAVYFSTDMTLSNDDTFLGSRANPNALLPNTGYNNTLTFQLPNGISGEYYVIVCSDKYADMPESDETNNCGVVAIPMLIQLSPFPDLTVTAFPPIGADSIILAGDNYDVQWTVENQNNGINPGATQSGFWYDRIYISTESDCDGTLNNNLIHLKTVLHEGNLQIGESYTAATNITIPAGLEDTVYLFVITDIYDEEYEYVLENNNCLTSIAYKIPITPRPDFLIQNLSVTDTVSNREIVSLEWIGKNESADFSGTFSDRIYISEHPDFSGWYETLGSTQQDFSGNPLNTDATYQSEEVIQIPSSINGKYYLIVRANGYNQVEETNFTNNTIVDSIVIISPNLVVTEIDTIPDAFSGQTITIGWEIANIEAGDLLSTYVVDRIRLIDVNNSNNSIFLGTVGDNLTIFSNDDLTRSLNFNIPNGLTGAFCIEVVTNYNENAFENGLYNDNSLTQCDTFNILSADYPNLVATSIESADISATAGETVEVTFSIRNEGDVATSDFWSDIIYLDTSQFFNPNSAIYLGLEAQSQIIAPDNFYEKTITVQLPYYLQTGDYYFHLVTDNANVIFETNEMDNDTNSTNAISISVYPEVDLRFIGTPIGPDMLVPGQAATVTYEVGNQGNVATPISIWVDALYLSPNPTWEPSDILIKTWQRTGGLEADASYAHQESFTLPEGFTDAFYLCLVIDHENAVSEENENNNFIKILQQNGDTISIAYPPLPDLAVNNFEIADALTAGQPTTINYTIQNFSTEGNALGTWKESFYLSTDQTLNSSDVFLGQKNYNNGLNSSATYSDTYEVTIPLGIAGNYFILIKTDGGDHINETNELNNIKDEYVFITQPTPSDLVVLQDNIIVPGVDTIATNITLFWTTKNIGLNSISGYMEEGVYLSADTIWDSGDLLLGKWTGSIGLDPNASIEHGLTARLENVRRQDYYVFIKTDLLDHFLENDEENNCSIGTSPVFVEVPELPIGLPATVSILNLEQPIYYRIEIPNDTIGETMRVSITSTDSIAFNELYVRHNDIPSRNTYDYSFSAPFEVDQEIIIPAVEGGRYYIMAYAVDGTPIQDVTLLAEIIPFQITSIETNQGGNTGFVTTLLEGAKFQSEMEVQLEQLGFPTIMATQVNVINSSKAFVTFPLEGAAIGFYDVIAIVPSDQDTLENGFEIITGSVGNTPLQTSCSFDFSPQNIVLTNVPAGVEIVELETSHVPFVRPNQTIPITIRIKNTGDIDIPAPTRIFDSLNGFPLGNAVTDLQPGLAFLPLTFEEVGGPPEILRPGAVATIIVYTKADQDKDEMKFKLNAN